MEQNQTNNDIDKGLTQDTPQPGVVPDFSPENYQVKNLMANNPLINKTSTTAPLQPVQYQFEFALKSNVDVQLKALEMHTDDCIRVISVQLEKLKAETDGKIDLLRKEINDLNSEKKDKKQKNWDTKIVVCILLPCKTKA